MAEFSYQATNQSGTVIEGVVDATTRLEAKKRLQLQGLEPLKITKVAEFTMQEMMSREFRAINDKDLYMFTKYFSIIMRAGIPVIKGLGILENQTPNIRLKKKIYKIYKDIEGGIPMFDAFGKHSEVFPPMYLSLIKIGEESGLLYEMLQRLTVNLEKDLALKKKVKGAMVYPIVIAVVAGVVVTFLMLWVIPRFSKMFSKFGADLPLPTKFVMNTSTFITTYIVHMLAVIGGIYMVYNKINSTRGGRRVFDNIKLRIPLFGTLTTKFSVTQLCQNLSVLLRSGLPITKAMEITVNAIENVIIQEEMSKVKDDIESGVNIADAFRKTKSVPSMVTEMVNIGDQAGTLEEMLQNIAHFYEEEVDTLIDTMTGLIEPVFIMGLGGVVGTIVVAMFLPIFTMSKVVMGKE